MVACLNLQCSLASCFDQPFVHLLASLEEKRDNHETEIKVHFRVPVTKERKIIDDYTDSIEVGVCGYVEVF